jgi:hypothetical protein
MDSIESPLDAENSAAASCRVVLTPDGGWDVFVWRGQEVLSVRHCTSWEGVERVCNELLGPPSAPAALVERHR